MTETTKRILKMIVSAAGIFIAARLLLGSFKEAVVYTAIMLVLLLGLAALKVWREIRQAPPPTPQWDPSPFLRVSLVPLPGRQVARPETFESPAAELTALGFVRVGCFQEMADRAYLEGWANPELKIYAVLSETRPGPARQIWSDDHPDVLLASYKVDGGSVGVVSGAPGWSDWPEDIERVHLPAGVSVGEILARLLEMRPAEGWRDTPPEDFQAVTEEEMTRLARLNAANYYRELGSPGDHDPTLFKLKPLPERGLRNREIMAGLAEELICLGFKPAGFFKVLGHEIYMEGLADPKRRIYATLTDVGPVAPPFTALTSVYADRAPEGPRSAAASVMFKWLGRVQASLPIDRYYTVTSSTLPDPVGLPEDLRPLTVPEARPAELLKLLLDNRPLRWLERTPPRKFQRFIEESAARDSQYI